MLTSAKSLGLLKQFTYKHLKVLEDVETSTKVKDEGIRYITWEKFEFREKEEESTIKIVMLPKILKEGDPRV